MFLNGIMLAGLGAAVLPIVLHLLNRARGRQVQWGAMLFLKESPDSQRSSRQWRQRAVLALRVATIVLVTLALARPQLPGVRTIAPPVNTALVIVIDGSPSMTHPELNATRFELARRAAAADLAQLHRGDQVTLIELGGPWWDQPLTSDLQSVASELASLTPLAGSANLSDGVRRAGVLLRAADGASRVIHLISDRQQSGWIDLPNQPLDWRRGAKVIATPIGSTDDENVSVESVDLTGPAAVVGCPVGVTVKIHNWSDAPVRSLNLRLNDGHREVVHVLVDLDARATRSIDSVFIPQRSGSMVLTAKIDALGIATDNVVSLACDVMPTVNVAVLEAATQSSTQPAWQGADYLVAALAASHAPGGPPAFNVRRVLWHDEPTQSDAQVIVLADTIPLTSDEAEALQMYVFAGGGLLIAPGANVSPDVWRNFSEDGPSPLPELGEKKLGHQQIRTSADAAKVFGPAADIFAGVTFDAWHPLKPTGAGKVISQFTNGEPFAVTTDFGEGRVVTLAGPIDASWSNLPRTTAFLPVIQNAIRYLTGDHPARRNVYVGNALDATIDHPGLLPRDRLATIQRPDNRFDRSPLIMNGLQGVVHYTNTDIPGHYVLRANGQADLDFIVRAYPGESNLALMPDATLDPLLQSASITRTSDDVARMFARPVAAPSPELAPAFLALAAACLVLDAWLATRIGPRPAVAA